MCFSSGQSTCKLSLSIYCLPTLSEVLDETDTVAAYGDAIVDKKAGIGVSPSWIPQLSSSFISWAVLGCSHDLSEPQLPRL